MSWPRRVLPALVLVLSLAGLAFLSACGSEPSGDEAAPGFSDDGIVYDTTPFELAGPSGSAGSTTLPSGMFAPDEIAESTTTTETGALERVDPASITTICGFERTIAPFIRLPEKSPAETEALFGDLLVLIARYGEVAEPALKDDLVVVLQSLTEIRDVLASNGWDARSEAFQSVILSVGASATDDASLGGALATVVAAERASCG